MARRNRTVLVASVGLVVVALFVGHLSASGAAQPSRTVLSISPDHSSRDGDEVTLSAVVSAVIAEDGVPGGTVEFFDGLNAVGSAELALDNGRHVAKVTWTPRAGSHTLTARYSGDSVFAASASIPVVHAVAAREVVR